MKTSDILRRIALVLTYVVSAGGLLFALGYAFEDPGGWVAVGMTAAVVVPLAALVVLAVRAPRAALVALAVAVGLFAVWAVLDGVYHLVDAPTIPVIALVLAVPIAIVGQHEAVRAGGLMLAVAAVPFVLVLVRMIRESGVEGPGFGDLLGGSTGVVIIPVAVLALLLLTAGLIDRRETHPQQRRTQPPPRAAQQH